MSNPEDLHVPQACTIPGCTEEATRWFEDPAYPKNTRYVCLEHKEIAAAEEADHNLITNSAGQRVELAAYQCHAACEVCD